jgi:hypothetical protein
MMMWQSKENKSSSAVKHLKICREKSEGILGMSNGGFFPLDTNQAGNL